MTTEHPATLDPQRRHVLQTLVGTGFAAATLPISAQTIQTDTQGIQADAHFIPTFDGKLAAYVARPAKSNGPLPTVLVVSEIFGVHEYIKDVARRLAKQGYLAIAPELFTRQGDPSKISDIPTILKDVISKVPDEQVMKDLDACVAWAHGLAKTHGGTQGKNQRVGITGFCWGGRITWLYAAHNPNVTAAVAWYGRVTGAATPLTPQHPVDVADKLHGPVLGLYGEKDTGITLDTVEAMRSKLLAVAAKNPNAARSDIVVYPDAPHAFHADYRPSYRAEAAKDGWEKLTAWFEKYL